MTRLVAPVLLALAIASPAAAETQRLSLSGFEAVSAAGRFEMTVTQGPYAVELSGDDIDKVTARIEDGTLRIHQREDWFGRDRKLDLVVRVTGPQLEGIAASRGAEVTAGDLRVGNFSLDAAMGGTIEITGTCARLDASAAMGGAINAETFICESVDASAAMGGSMEVYAQQSVDASASMGGAVDVRGNPARRDTTAAMGGAISLR